MDSIIQKIKLFSKQDKTVLANMLGAFLIRGFALLLSVLIMPAYIHYFQNQTILGVWYTIISVLNWILYFDLGLGNGLRNLLPAAIAVGNKKKVKAYISTTYITMTSLVGILALLGFIIIPNINWNSVLNVPEESVGNSTLAITVLIVYIGILLQFIFKLITSVLYALQKSAVVNFMTLISSVIILIALYIMPSSSLEINLYRMAFVNVLAAIVPSIVVSFFIYGKVLHNSFPSIKFYNKDYVASLLKIGVSLLWLQLVFMLVSSTNEFLISRFTSPEYVVEYQAYYKIFKTGAMIFSLALTPIWSAVTKAQAEKNYIWIIKVYKIFLCCTMASVLVEFMIVFILQPLMDIWLGKNLIDVNLFYAITFAFSGSLLVLHNVNTSIGNGVSYFKVQIIWMTFAAIIFIPLSYIVVYITESWIGVVIAQIIALLPYETLAPIYTMKYLKREREGIKVDNS